MSRNYYIRTKDPEMAFDLLPRVEMVSESREFEIHLCQTILYFGPMLEAHSFKTFKELKDILLNKGYTFKIVDDYDKEFSPNDFIDMLIFERNGTPRRNKFPELLKDECFHVDEDGFEWLDYEFR